MGLSICTTLLRFVESAMIDLFPTVFLVFFVIFHSTLAERHAPDSLIWYRGLRKFIPIKNISMLKIHHRNQQSAGEFRELENHDFHGHDIRLGYFEDKNMVNFIEENTKVTGACGEIWNILAELLNFKLVVKKTEIFGNAVTNANKDIKGVIGMVKHKEIDVIPKIDLSNEFSEDMNFTMPIWEDRYKFYTLRRTKSDSTWVFYMFTREAWYSIFALLLAFTVIGYSMQRISIGVFGDKKFDHRLHDHLFYTFATFCDQNYIPDIPNRWNKMFSLLRTVFSWLLLIIMNSNLISWLSNNQNLASLGGTESLLNDSRYSMVMSDTSMVFFPFKERLNNFTDAKTSIPYGQCNKNENHIILVNSSKELYKQGCGTKKQFVMFESENTYQASGKYVCELVPIGLRSYSTWVTFGLIGDFKYKRSFDIGIIKLKEFGLIDVMKKRWIESVTDGESQSSFTPVNIEQVSMLFAILCTGMVASVVILVLENVVVTYTYLIKA